MSQPLPQVPKPEFVLIAIEAPPEVPTQIAVDLRETGVPGGLIGYEYRPLSEPVYFGGIGERGLVAIATSGLFGRIAVDVASGHVVQIPHSEAVGVQWSSREDQRLVSILAKSSAHSLAKEQSWSTTCRYFCGSRNRFGVASVQCCHRPPAARYGDARSVPRTASR